MKIRAYKNENPLEELIDVLKKASRKGCDSVEIRLGFDEINKLLKELQWALSMDTADTPQTDCETCRYGQDKHRYAHICNECGVGINNYTPQTESTGSPIGDYRDGVGAWQTDCDDRYAVRTDSGEVVAYACPLGCEQTDCDKCIWNVCNYNEVEWDADTPQTDCGWGEPRNE